MISLTRKQVIDLGPCSTSKIPNYGLRKTMNAKQALNAGTTIPDLLWVAARLKRKDLCVKFALACAQRVSHNNKDPRVQQALNATKRVIENDTEETRSAAMSAALSIMSAAESAAWSAARSVTLSAALSTQSTAESAWSAAWSAARSVTLSAARSVTLSAARSARYAEQLEQRRIFIKIFSGD